MTDPTPSLQRKMNAQLLQLKKDGSLPDCQYNKLRCSSGSIPCIYGLPKVHKPNVPLRPIVSYYTSPTYFLSKFLAKLLTPLIGSTSSFVRNSRDFVSSVKSLTLEEDEVLVSFDVVSLFTTIPVNLALQVARQRLEADDTLSDRTTLNVAEIMSLLSLCLNATFFRFREVFYQQIFGTPMGSPVSVVMANLVMEDIEDRALISFPTPPRFWKRYVDDVFSVVPRKQIARLHQHLNSMESSIQFTLEVENNQCLPFLDVLVTRCNGSVCTTVYRKPSHTDRYLDFTSHHPLVHKAAVVRTLLSRADVICSSPTLLEKEHTRVGQALTANSYPSRFVGNNSQPKVSRQHPDEQHHRPSVVIPYIRGLSEALYRVFSDADIKVVHRPYTTLRQVLCHPKDPTLPAEKSSVVYCIPCSTCNDVYIGQTGRLLATRLKEHRAAVKFAKTDVSAVAEHIWQKQHQMDFQATTVLAQENDKYKRCVLESWHIQTQKCMNREIGVLAPVYRCLF